MTLTSENMNSKAIFDLDKKVQDLVEYKPARELILEIKCLNIEGEVFPICPRQWHRSWKDLVGFVGYNQEIESMYGKR